MLAAVLAVLVLVVALVARGGGIKLPDSVAGEPRNTSQLAKTTVEALQTLGAVGGEKPKAAFYGSLNGPGVLVAVYQEGGPDVDTIFAQMTRGFSATSPVALDLAAEVTSTSGTAQFECAPYSGRVSGNLCVWSDGRTIGMVMSIGAVNPDGLDLVSEVYTSVEPR